MAVVVGRAICGTCSCIGVLHPFPVCLRWHSPVGSRESCQTAAAGSQRHRPLVLQAVKVTRLAKRGTNHYVCSIA